MPRPESINMQLRLKLRLTVRNPEPREVYSLGLFASRDVKDDEAYTLNTEAKVNEWCTVQLKLKCQPHVPSSINCWLFTTTSDASGLEAQTLLAWGKCMPHQLLASQHCVKLFDIDDALQGDVTLQLNDESCTSLLAALGTGQDPEPPQGRTLMQKMVNDVKKCLRRYQPMSDGAYSGVRSQEGVIPMLAYCVLSQQIHAPPQQAQNWLTHLLRLSLPRLGLRATINNDWHEGVQQQSGPLIAEMALWQVRAKLYAYDEVRLPNQRREQIDQWTRIGCFPSPGIAAGDCEDFSLMLLEFFHVLTTTHFDSSLPHGEALAELQQYALKYSACLVVGQLQMPDGCQASHAYVMLLDAEWIQAKVDNRPEPAQPLPAIVLEGTAYTESQWSTKTIKIGQTSDRVFDVASELLDVPILSDDNQKWDRCIKFRMPASRVNSDAKYGRIFALLVNNYRSGQALHCLVTQQGACGLAHAQVALYSPDVQLDTALRVSPSECRLINATLRDLPYSHFELAPLSPAAHIDTGNCSNQCVFDIRASDFDKFETQLRLAFKQFCSSRPGRSVQFVRVPVSQHIELVTAVVSLPAEDKM